MQALDEIAIGRLAVDGDRELRGIAARFLREPIPVLDECADRFGATFGLGAGPARLVVVGDPRHLATVFAQPTTSYRWGHWANVLGFIVGPAVVGVLGNIDLRLPFWVAAALSLANAGYGYFILPESLPPERRASRFEWRGANPLGALALLRSRPLVLGLSAAMFLYFVAHESLPAMWVLYTSYRYQWSPADVGLSLAFFGDLYGFVQGVVVRIVVPRLGELQTLILGLAVAGGCLFLFAAADRGWMLYAILVPYVLAWGNAGPAVQALLTKAVGSDEQGLLQGAIASVGTATGIVAPPIGAGLFAWFISPAAPVAFPGIAFALGGVLFLAALAVTQTGRFQLSVTGNQ